MKRLKIIFTVLLLLVNVVAADAQERVPDEDDILRSIIDSQSPYYYPSLMLRYEAGDTTLSIDDYYYLYYGYAYQDSYKPLEPVAGETELLAVLERSPRPNADEAADIMSYAKKVMEADPFSPKNINFMAYACAMMGDTTGAVVNTDRLNKIFATITSTGTGLKENSPWHVLWFSHASDMIASMGKDILNRQVRTRSVEYIAVARKTKDEPKGYFFDFGRMYWKKPEDLPKRQKRVSGFELNGMPIGGQKNTEAPAR